MASICHLKRILRNRKKTLPDFLQNKERKNGFNDKKSY